MIASIRGVVVGRTPDGKRVVAMTAPEDDATVAAMIAKDPLGGSIETRTEGGRNYIASFTSGDRR